MLDISDRLFLCYCREDAAIIHQLICQIEHEIEAKISHDDSDSGLIQLTEEINDRIADSEIFIIFISKNAKQSDFVRQCTVRASHLNKNILPLKIDKQEGFFGSKIPQEFKFHSKTFDYHNPKSKAEFFIQLKAYLGFTIEGGDPFGALVHVSTDRDTRIWRNDDIIGYTKSDSGCRIRLAQGVHTLNIQDVEYPSFFVYINVKITDPEVEQFISIPIQQLLKEKQEREEHERIITENHKRREQELLKEDLRLQALRRQEALKRQEELRLQRERDEEERRLKYQHQIEAIEKLKLREQKFRIMDDDLTDNDNSNISSIFKWVIAITIVIIIFSLF